jgi:hypothetical protein
MIAKLSERGVAAPCAPFSAEFIGSRDKPGNDVQIE